LGDNNQNVAINGQSFTTGFGGPTGTFPGGIYTQASNIGTRTRNALVVVPEIQMQLGYKLPNGLRPFIAYNFIYLSNVVRPGDQVDTTLNFSGNTPIAPGIAQAGAARPQAMSHSTDFWAQGINIGVSYTF
jgi:hypothetical protein